jgi:hypothetical protein
MVTKKLGGNFVEPTHPDRWSDEIIYKIYHEWVVIGESGSHDEAVQMLHEALSDKGTILEVSTGNGSLVESELDATVGVC